MYIVLLSCLDGSDGFSRHCIRLGTASCVEVLYLNELLYESERPKTLTA
jgi:hypothetical protein